MEAKVMSHSQQPRPYFLPAELDFDSLPPDVRLTINEIVVPAYTELVVGAPSALERLAAVSVVFLLTWEILAQSGIGLLLSGFAGLEDSEKRAKAMDRYLRLANAKLSSAQFLLRIKQYRNRIDPLRPGGA
jgi:hypothetical protein